MRKLSILILALAFAAGAANAQIGKRVAIQAGTPEDKALQEIGAETDSTKKVELLQKYLTDFASSDVVLAGYEMILAHYLAEKNAAKVYEYADKALAIDSGNFGIAFFALRAAQEGSDIVKLFQYGELIGGILTRYRASPAPQGMEAEQWAGQQRAALGEAQDNIAYTEFALFSTGNNTTDPARKADFLERFVLAFPESPYAFAGSVVTADAYRQARQGPKMVAFAEKVLQRDPNHYGMLIQLADYWVEGKEQLDKAIQYATKALGILNAASQPPNLTPEQWTQQKNLQMGLAHSAIGQAHVHASRDAQAAEAFKSAAPLLKPVKFYFARCLYLWGFALTRQKKNAEARPLLQEAASLDTPYKPLAQESLSKLGAAPAKAAKKRP